MSFSMGSSNDDDDSSSLSSDLPLPNEISMDCFALVPRRYYPALSHVSKPFRGLITSPQLYLVRSLLQSTEKVLYVALRFRLEETLSWYSLTLKPLKDESVLAPIPSFPSLPFWGSSTIAIGYEIYVFGGCINEEFTSKVFVVDCRFHTWEFLQSMRVARACAATGVIDGKVYVIGGCKPRSQDWIEVFDLKTRSWEESVPCPCNEEVKEKILKSFVMNEKIYMMDRTTSFVYDPKKRWEVDEELNKQWSVGSCVVDNMLYTFGYKSLVVYDPVLKVWSVLKGVGELHDKPSMSRMANFGGKLAVLFEVGGRMNDGMRMTEIICTEIELERRGEGGEVWGKIVSSTRVLRTDVSSTIVNCLTVTI